MEKVKKQEFTSRVAVANRTELIVIMYEMILEEIEDLKIVIKNGERKALEENIKQIRSILNHLMGSLDYHYSLSFILMRVYAYINKLLSEIIGAYDTEKLAEAESIVKKLRDDFYEIAQRDHSEPVMRNSESIYAGLTYGRQSLNESVGIGNEKRGITV